MSPEEIFDFAKQEVFSTLAGRYEKRQFSRALWKRMAEAGLFGYLIPSQYGGSDKGPRDLVEAIEAFILGGRDLGLCLSWLGHLLIHARVIARYGTREQMQRYLPALVRGDRVGALAASEPGTGANPVDMKTRAEHENGGYRINGHKIFITNGPVADSVIVLARTGPAPGKEGISAFLLDTSTAGFRVKEEMDFGFLYTSPHGELLLEDCTVPAENLLGRLGEGHTRISRTVFGWERSVGLVTLAAHFRGMLDHMILAMVNGSPVPDLETRRLVAELHISLEGIREVSRDLACEVLDRTDLDVRLTERLLFIVRLLTQWWDQARQRVDEVSVFPLELLVKDARLLQINRRLYELQTVRIYEVLQKRAARKESK